MYQYIHIAIPNCQCMGELKSIARGIYPDFMLGYSTDPGQETTQSQLAQTAVSTGVISHVTQVTPR